MAERARDLDRHGLDRLVDAARLATTGEVDDAAHAAGRERFERAIERSDRAGLPVARRWPWIASAAAIAVAAAILVFVLRPARLEIAVEGAALQGGYVHATSAARARFSDGTEIELRPGARARIADVGPHGARVIVEEGKLVFHLARRPGADWTTGAGPFSIKGDGTDFDVTWGAERFELELRAGTLMVKGPLISDGLAVKAGQRVVADLGKGKLSVEERDPTARAALPEPAAVASSAPAPASAPSDAVESAPTAVREIAPRPPTWRELVARGEFARVLTEAEARGVDASIADAPLAELAALADAARYSGKNDLARRALLAERDRFPGSAEARSAAFLLGRLDEGGAPAAAIGWYDRYLAESPSGSLAGEALGRKMITTRKSSGSEAARPSAEAYLKRYPSGPFAAAAEEIVGTR